MKFITVVSNLETGDARELSDRLYMNKLSSVYHGEAGVRTL
jgi:hypothetical protein